ncbi:MAG TPA: hypothetical protein VFR74_08675 [Jiangellales bacterium]|nr:hypothetical protein [Jiangellales bacterium]
MTDAAEQPVTCAWCGRTAPGERVPMDWVGDVAEGRQRYYCPVCAREHLRSIEARLDQEWW